MDDTSPHSSGAAVSTWLPIYSQAFFFSASFLVSNNGLNSKHLTYINVVRNTKKNIFLQSTFFYSLDYYNSQPLGGAQMLHTVAGPTEECSALPSFVYHLYMPEIFNLISKLFLVSVTSTMSLINLIGFFFFSFFGNYFSGFRHICKQWH